MPQFALLQRIRFHPQEALLRGVIWAFVGLIYAALYVPLWEYFKLYTHVSVSYVLATVASGALGGLFYGSMRLAFIVAIFTNIAVFGYLVSAGGYVDPRWVIALGAGVGLVVGAIYGATVKDSHVFRADAKFLAGGIAGLLASSVAIIAAAAEWQWPLAQLLGFLAPVTGFIYVLLVPWFLRRFSRLLPPTGDGALVGAAVGGFVGLGLWIMGGNVLDEMAGPWAELSDSIVAQWPMAIAFAAGGAFVLGFIRSLFDLSWVDF